MHWIKVTPVGKTETILVNLAAAVGLDSITHEGKPATCITLPGLAKLDSGLIETNRVVKETVAEIRAMDPIKFSEESGDVEFE